MADGKQLQSRNCTVWILLLCALLLFAVSMFAPAAAFLEPAGANPTSSAIRTSAIWPVVWWCFSWPLLFTKRRECFYLIDDLAALWRVLWTLGCVLMLLHVAVAFHLGHAWSHQAAWWHTQEVGGYGDGIYVNYAFVLVWLVDVIWSWVSFRTYLARPMWLRWLIFLFLLFVMVNAAVILAPALNSRLLFGLVVLTSGAFHWRVWRAGG